MCLEGAITREQRERLKQTEREDLEKAFSKKLSLVDDGKSGGGRKASSSSSSSKKNADAATMESSDLREVIEKKRAGASAEKGVGKSGEKVNKEQQHAQSPSTKNSRQRRAEMRKEKREGAQETKKKSSDKSTSVAQAATAASESGKKKKKENDVGGEALEVLKKSQEEAAKMEKKKKEEEEKNTADEEGPPGYPQPKYSDYLAKKETEKEEDTKKKEYTSPFAHILQCAPTPLPPSFDTPQGARGEGFVLGDRDKVPTSLFNVDSTWQGSAAFAPPTKLTRESIKSIPSFTPARRLKLITTTTTTNHANAFRERKKTITSRRMICTKPSSAARGLKPASADTTTSANSRRSRRVTLRREAPKVQNASLSHVYDHWSVPVRQQMPFHSRKASRKRRLGYTRDQRALRDHGRLETGRRQRSSVFA